MQSSMKRSKVEGIYHSKLEKGCQKGQHVSILFFKIALLNLFSQSEKAFIHLCTIHLVDSINVPESLSVFEPLSKEC